MAIVWTTEPLQQSKATAAVVIKNPNEVKNAFTVTDAPEASAALQLDSAQEVNQLKDFLKDYDMTSISTDELKKVGRRLYNSGAIDEVAFGMFISGNGEFDEKGNQANTHVRYNAVALFNQRFEEYSRFLEEHPVHSNSDNLRWKQGMIAANHAVGALAYFANSASHKLALDEQA
ncbi:hypothetical protein QF043_002943 [Pseudomonas sp. W3I7]|jgi:hypothetical protein|uniref:hypothetical protein n=1 Tax=Pseudomonas sp. W3I7 TaxID=3042292 RepID=UPI002794C2CA|nr:hypothetical protein [Pseudomonas sp. W3I7]MDQ0704151.1 hypothetical protein [Pseudomonas sp. W3I7]